MFGWWKARRRRQRLERPFPAEWQQLLESRCRHYAALPPAQQQLLRDRLRLLIEEKHWEGCNGVKVTLEMQITIAAQAALIGLGFPTVPFDRLLSILIYPDAFLARQPQAVPWGYENRDIAALGQAAYQGPVLLSWREVARDCFEFPAGRNVVIHEFAHLLDMDDHRVDGMPTLSTPEETAAWEETVPMEFRRLRRQQAQGRRTLIDEYGASSEIEFFAVASETFFERPQELAAQHPRLYAVYRSFYKQDPAEWRKSGE